MLRLHILVHHSVPTDRRILSDAFNQMAIRLCEAMTDRGHQTIFYGTTEFQDQIKCSIFCPIMSLSEYPVADFNSGAYLSWLTDINIVKAKERTETLCQSRIYDALVRNVQPDDIVIICYGDTEPSTFIYEMAAKKGAKICNGYVMGGCFRTTIKFRHTIFSSTYTRDKRSQLLDRTLLSWTVIPPFLLPQDFSYNPHKKINPLGPFLYLARIQLVKGVGVFLDLSRRHPDKQFSIAGASQVIDNNLIVTDDKGDNIYYNLNDYPNVIYWGLADQKLRATLMASASALIQPTLYVEPFGLNVVEAHMSGIPTITSNNGGFLDTVIDGVNGFKCNTWEQYDWAINNISQIKPKDCRQTAMDRYSPEVVIPKLEKYLSNMDHNWLANL